MGCLLFRRNDLHFGTSSTSVNDWRVIRIGQNESKNKMALIQSSDQISFD